MTPDSPPLPRLSPKTSHPDLSPHNALNKTDSWGSGSNANPHVASTLLFSGFASSLLATQIFLNDAGFLSSKDLDQLLSPSHLLNPMQSLEVGSRT